jgi:hypothetical protein
MMVTTNVTEHLDAEPYDDGQSAAHDPWAHRRGEPRTFTLLWTIYLLCATSIAILSVGLQGAVLEEGARSAARIILQTSAIGMMILWPMVRLSQLQPTRGSVGWAAKDTFVILVPLQVVIWPQIWWAHWSMNHAAASASVLGAWASLVGAMLAFALAGEPPREIARGVWMMVFVVLLAVGPLSSMMLFAFQAPATNVSEWLQMTSPMTAIDELAPRRAWHGSAEINREHWVAIGLTVVAGATMWLAALARARGGARRRALR